MELSGEGSITLDRQAFKALASRTRVEILKKLDGTQKTVSDLARDMEMNKATMFEHLEQLVEVGLVRKDTEEERATTVKPVGLEAPVMGPPKKWVYYRLTWKGKNVLHPERVKISILLSAAALALALAGLLYLAAFSPGPAPEPSAVDTSPPLVMNWQLAPVRQGAGVDIGVTVVDNTTGKVSGLDIARCELVWGISKDAGAIKPDVRDWSALSFTFPQNSMVATVPATDWSIYNGSYLLIGVHLFDRAGNSAWYFNSEPVRTFFGPELDIVAGSLTASADRSGGNYVLIKGSVRNDGNGDAGQVLVAIYSLDPDPLRTGRASRSSLATVDAGPLAAGASAQFEMRMTSRNIRPGIAYLMVDPGGNVSEADEGNNVVSMNIPASAIPDKPAAAGAMAPGFGLAAAVGALVAVIVLGGRPRKPRD